MTIELNKVTWYSKIAAVILFVGVFYLGYWLGTQQAVKIYVEVPHVIHRDVLVSNLSTNQDNIQLQGHVSRRQTYEKDFGNGLVFQLIPNDNGWNIEIIPAGVQNANDYGFASIATPPFHGPTPLQIEGWSFANASDTNETTRDFFFVLNKQDANITADAVQQLMSGKTSDFSPGVPLGQGELNIQNMKLGNLASKSQAWIESMDFSVSLKMPRKK